MCLKITGIIHACMRHNYVGGYHPQFFLKIILILYHLNPMVSLLFYCPFYGVLV